LAAHFSDSAHSKYFNYLLMETSRSFRQSTIVLLCRCTALWSVCTVFNNDVKATYLG